MPIYNEIDQYLILLNDWKSKYPLAHEVMELQQKYDFVEKELGELLATLSLEINRERLRKGEGWEELFKIVDETRERVKKHE